MHWYNADIGTWETGYLFEFQADSDECALSVAQHEATKTGRGVVQIRRGKRAEYGLCVFDEINGFYNILPKEE